MYIAFITFRDRCVSWCGERIRGPYANPFLFLIAFAESIFFPIPVDAFLVPVVIVRVRSWKYYTVLVSLASILGGIAGYAIGFFLFSLIGSAIIGFYGLEAAFSTAERWFAEYALLATLLSAFTPIPYKVFTLSAGFLNVPFLVFVLGSSVGRTLRFAMVAYIAHRWGALITKLFLRYFTFWTALAAAVALTAYVLWTVVS